MTMSPRVGSAKWHAAMKYLKNNGLPERGVPKGGIPTNIKAGGRAYCAIIADAAGRVDAAPDHDASTEVTHGPLDEVSGKARATFWVHVADGVSRIRLDLDADWVSIEGMGDVDLPVRLKRKIIKRAQGFLA